MMHCKRGTFGLLALSAAIACGCNKDPYQVVPVSGTVTLDGQPLANARLSFQPAASSKAADAVVGPGSVGFSNEQGQFSLETVQPIHQGAVVATHLVRVTTGKEESSADDARVIGEKVPRHYLANQVKIVKQIDGPTDSLTIELFSDRRKAAEAGGG